jgi:hypothetical protein
MKFSIRDLFLVTVIVAVCAAWWVDRSRMEEIIRRQEEKLDEWALELAGLKMELQSWPQVRLFSPPGMKWQLVPKSPAPAANPPKP